MQPRFLPIYAVFILLACLMIAGCGGSSQPFSPYSAVIVEGRLAASDARELARSFLSMAPDEFTDHRNDGLLDLAHALARLHVFPPVHPVRDGTRPEA